MVAAEKTLLELTAADLMSRVVVMVPEQMSLAAAAHLLTQNQVSGAPVVDAAGRCVGVLSTTDFMHFLEKARSGNPQHACRTEQVYSAWQVVASEETELETVADLMNRDPVMACPTTGVGRLAQSMLDAHVHRVVIVDEECRPIGIVSATDILAAVAREDMGSEL